MSETIKERMAKHEFLRGIDRLIAGITGVKPCSTWHCAFSGLSPAYLKNGEMEIPSNPDWSCGHKKDECFPEEIWPPTYSSSADAALDAAVKFTSCSKRSFSLFYLSYDHKYVARIEPPHGGDPIRCQADTAALAICYALLKANGIEIPREAGV